MPRAVELIKGGFCCVLLIAAGCGEPPPAWEKIPLGKSADFREIAFTDPGNGWIVGGSFQITGGLIGRTADAGRTWRFTSDLTPRERMSVQAMHRFDATRAIVATDSGAILRTLDGGETWTLAARRGRINSLTSLVFLDERRGWAAGHGDVLATDDGGASWTPLTAKGADSSYRPQIRAIHFLDARQGWAAGMNALLMHTADGGTTWENVAPPVTAGTHPDFWDMCFVDAHTAWVVGDEETIVGTRDGGRTWTRQSLGLKHDDGLPGLTLTAVRFLDLNRGWITGLYAGHGRSLILRTENAGATWAVDADIAGEDLYTLAVQGREHLWTVGARVREGPQSIYRRSLATK